MQNEHLLQALKELNERLIRIERMAGIIPPETVKMEKSPQPLPLPKAKRAPSNILGIVGVGCLILAAILLIKFSIDSGWLTPPRQMILSFLFGTSLMALPFIWMSKDVEYLSLLPAGGIVVFHLTIYGSIFYHQLLAPELGIWLVWGVGCLSLALLKHFNQSAYAVLAIGGTYLGFIFLTDSHGLVMTAFFLLMWDLIFTSFGVYLANRGIIVLTAYFSIGLVALMDGSPMEHSIIQMLQALIIAGTTGFYSIKNRQSLSDKDSFMLFFVFLFFYGIQFNNLDKIHGNYAVAFSLVFSALILSIYFFARRRLEAKSLESTPWVFTLVSAMVLHSIYFVSLNDFGKAIAGLVLLVGLGALKSRLPTKQTGGVLVLSGLAIGYSLLLVTFNPDNNLFTSILVPLGFAYGILLFGGGILGGVHWLVVLAHFMNLVAFARLGEFMGEFWVGPLCVIYAYGCLFLAYRRLDKVLAKSAFPIIFFAIGRFLFMTFENLGQGERIISLIIMGALIYGGGYLYRQIPAKENA